MTNWQRMTTALLVLCVLVLCAGGTVTASAENADLSPLYGHWKLWEFVDSFGREYELPLLMSVGLGDAFYLDRSIRSTPLGFTITEENGGTVHVDGYPDEDVDWSFDGETLEIVLLHDEIIEGKLSDGKAIFSPESGFAWGNPWEPDLYAGVLVAADGSRYGFDVEINGTDVVFPITIGDSTSLRLEDGRLDGREDGYIVDENGNEFPALHGPIYAREGEEPSASYANDPVLGLWHAKTVTDDFGEHSAADRNEIALILRDDGTCYFCHDAYFLPDYGRWTLDGERLELSFEHNEWYFNDAEEWVSSFSGSLSDGVLKLGFLDETIVYTREATSEIQTGEPTEEQREFWSGNWYGYWELSDLEVPTPAGTIKGDCSYVSALTDAVARLSLDDEGRYGELHVWDRKSGEEIYQADVMISGVGDNEHGRIYLLDCSCFGGDQSILFSNYIEYDVRSNTIKFSDYGIDNGLSTRFYMAKWGERWQYFEEQAKELTHGQANLPEGYYDWYLPLIETGAEMPTVEAADERNMPVRWTLTGAGKVSDLDKWGDITFYDISDYQGLALELRPDGTGAYCEKSIVELPVGRGAMYHPQSEEKEIQWTREGDCLEFQFEDGQVMSGWLFAGDRVLALQGDDYYYYFVPESAEAEAEERPQLFAPDFTLTDQNGDTHTLSDYRGKVVFLNIWATWCPPCRSEMPAIQRLYAEATKNPDADYVILGVAFPNLDGETNEDGIRRFLKNNGYTYPTLLDSEYTVAMTYGISSYPTTYMIDRSGKLFGYVIGSMTRDEMLEVIRLTSESAE